MSSKSFIISLRFSLPFTLPIIAETALANTLYKETPRQKENRNRGCDPPQGVVSPLDIYIRTSIKPKKRSWAYWSALARF